MSKNYSRRSKSERVRHISTRVTEDEYARLLARADSEGISLSEWARRTIEKAISDAEAQRALMAELWRLSFVIFNGLPTVAGTTDPAVVDARLRSLVSEADLRKVEKARRLLGES